MSQQWYENAERLAGFEKPRVWSVLTPLSLELNASNLGQGFPTWKPPKFYRNYLAQQIAEGNHQYVRSFGSINLVQAIAKFHEKSYPKINPLTDIVTTNGGSEALFCCFLGFLNPGDEVIFFDPSYDCYRSQIQMAGGKSVGFPLKPVKSHTKEQLKQRFRDGVVQSNQQDQWFIDFQLLSNTFNQKTKILLINSPHNPVGKVFTTVELNKIANIVKQFPRVVVIQDNVYEGMTFDNLLHKPLPKIAFLDEMYERTVSVYSGGKLFAATGMRSGWAIGNSKLISSVRSVHQYNVFCYYNIIENALAKSLVKISTPDDTYLKDFSLKLQNLRNQLIKQLVNCKFDIDLWVPKGSNFVIVDISRVEIKDKYFKDENGEKRTRDYAFALQLLYEDKVSVIPCSPFYDPQNAQDREKYIRVTFCKDLQIIQEAGKRMSV